MVKKYIQPVMHTVRVVLRDGRSILVNSVLKRESPIITQIDVTNSPYWTGGKRENLEDGRVARFGRRFTGSEDSLGDDGKQEAAGKS